MKHVVYIIQHGDGPIKIGFTDNIGKRLTQLQLANPQKLDVRFMIDCPSKKAAEEVEKILHYRYHGYRLRGEWYDVKPKTVIHDLEFVYSLLPYIGNMSVTEISRPLTYKFVNYAEPEPEYEPPVYERLEREEITSRVLAVMNEHLGEKLSLEDVSRILPTIERYMIKSVLGQLARMGVLMKVHHEDQKRLSLYIRYPDPFG